jgi:hypothetical protein
VENVHWTASASNASSVPLPDLPAALERLTKERWFGKILIRP